MPEFEENNLKRRRESKLYVLFALR